MLMHPIMWVVALTAFNIEHLARSSWLPNMLAFTPTPWREREEGQLCCPAEAVTEHGFPADNTCNRIRMLTEQAGRDGKYDPLFGRLGRWELLEAARHMLPPDVIRCGSRFAR
jgi:hypothetical protein